MPKVQGLPDDIRQLASLQAHTVDPDTWDADVRSLVRRTREILEQMDEEELAWLQRAGSPRTPDFQAMQGPNIHLPAHKAGERYRNFPTIGKWQVDLRAPLGTRADLGPAGHVRFTLTLRDDHTFVGEFVVFQPALAGHVRRSLHGRWALDSHQGSFLKLNLSAFIDGVEPSEWGLPIGEKFGDLYSASEGGIAFTFLSLGGSPEVDRQRPL
jgi:hypothetical protein